MRAHGLSIMAQQNGAWRLTAAGSWSCCWFHLASKWQRDVVLVVIRRTVHFSAWEKKRVINISPMLWSANTAVLLLLRAFVKTTIQRLFSSTALISKFHLSGILVVTPFEGTVFNLTTVRMSVTTLLTSLQGTSTSTFLVFAPCIGLNSFLYQRVLVRLLLQSAEFCSFCVLCSRLL